MLRAPCLRSSKPRAPGLEFSRSRRWRPSSLRPRAAALNAIGTRTSLPSCSGVAPPTTRGPRPPFTRAPDPADPFCPFRRAARIASRKTSGANQHRSSRTLRSIRTRLRRRTTRASAAEPPRPPEINSRSNARRRRASTSETTHAPTSSFASPHPTRFPRHPRTRAPEIISKGGSCLPCPRGSLRSRSAALVSSQPRLEVGPVAVTGAGTSAFRRSGTTRASMRDYC